jgi:hypothetical protein
MNLVGMGATKATGADLLEQRVLFKGVVALYYMNKPGGFKCPSCTWPDRARSMPTRCFLRKRCEGFGVGGDRQTGNA